MIDKKLDILSKIQKVEAPMFLDTRIRQHIANVNTNNFSPRIAWAMGFSLILVFAVNSMVLFNAKISEQERPNLAQTFDLLPQNELYK